MAKKKVTYSVFATVTVDEDVDPSKINRELQRAANNYGWQFAASVQEEPDGDLADVLEDITSDDY